MRVLTSIAVLGLVLASNGPADAAPAGEPVLYELHHDLWVDGTLTGGLFLGWLASEAVFKKDLAPPSCRWCDRAPDGSDTLNGFDRWARGMRGAPEQLGSFDMLSNAAGFLLLPAAIAGLDYWAASADGGGALVGTDLLLVAEAAVVTLSVNQVVKFLAGRERPFVHVLAESEKPLTHLPTDNNLSFFSGHSSFAFSITAAAATVAELRGYRRAWLLWALGVPAASGVALLRMAADKHYATDVLIGAAVGTAMGIAVPRLFHGRAGMLSRATAVRVVPTLGGVALTGTWD